MNAKEMRMKERLDILIQLGLEEDDALELLKSVYVEGALIGFAMATFDGDKSVFHKTVDSVFDNSLKI